MWFMIIRLADFFLVSGLKITSQLDKFSLNYRHIWYIAMMGSLESVHPDALLRFELIPMLRYLLDPDIACLIALIIFNRYLHTHINLVGYRRKTAFLKRVFASTVSCLLVLLAKVAYNNYNTYPFGTLTSQSLIAVLGMWLVLAIHYTLSSSVADDFRHLVWLFVYCTGSICLLLMGAKYYNSYYATDYNLLQFSLFVVARHTLASTFLLFPGRYSNDFICILRNNFIAYREGRLDFLCTIPSVRPAIKLIALVCLWILYTCFWACPSYMLGLTQLSMSYYLSASDIFEKDLKPKPKPRIPWQRRERYEFSVPNFVVLHVSLEVWQMALSVLVSWLMEFMFRLGLTSS
mmetsp:Transcript_10945/g.21408  ORF Transcript_10945/g.21408 Transcript_10945/m.21408 type:complete len:348 (-) Transcript_10945:955-1998(-)